MPVGLGVDTIGFGRDGIEGDGGGDATSSSSNFFEIIASIKAP